MKAKRVGVSIVRQVIVRGSRRLPQRVKRGTSPLQVPRSLNGGSAVFPDVSLAMQGLNKQQQMGSPLLSCATQPEYDSKTHFAELLLTVGYFERAVSYGRRK